MSKIIKGVLIALGSVVGFFVLITVLILISNHMSRSPESVTEQVEQKDIVVTSQAVKLVGDKYRYFFDIRNNDSESFSGDVNVELINAEGNSVYDKTFSSSQPIASGLGMSVYFDINTGPTSVHGTNGIKTFSYSVKAGGQVVKTGSGSISTSSQ